VIEHDMPLLSTICDRMIALELGAVIAEGTPSEVLEHPAVVESYLGTDESAINRSGAAAPKAEATAAAPPDAEAPGEPEWLGGEGAAPSGNGSGAAKEAAATPARRRTPLRAKPPA
jgi:ABC-type glutathione transport system ATPase component